MATRKQKTKKEFAIIKFNERETLTYDRVAHKANDGYDGLLFVHSWNSGFQRLIFRNYEHAKKWAENTLKAMDFSK